MWIFAYGSLIARPRFTFVERRRAYVRGWVRRFWQGSPDHRGVPEAPGRVVTLVADANDGACGGCAYRIAPEDRDAILAALDHREKAGFVRRQLPVHASPDDAPFAEALAYVADVENPWFLGPLPEMEIAALVRSRRGPSGPNADYVRELRDALAQLDIADPHVDAVASLLSDASDSV